MKEALAKALEIKPDKLVQALRCAEKNAWTDVGGVRVAWNKDYVVIESYTRIEGVTPADLLKLIGEP